MAWLQHADLVKPSTGAGSSRTGVRCSRSLKKARHSAGLSGSPYALANETGCRGCRKGHPQDGARYIREGLTEQVTGDVGNFLLHDRNK